MNFIKRNYYRALDLLWWFCIVLLGRTTNAPITFSHADIHSKIDKGINVMTPSEVPESFESDLVLAQEVIEHIPPAEVEAFVMQLRKWTRKVLALTCPDFTGCDTVRKLNIDSDNRYVPDHLKNFHPDSKDPYMHKFAVTPELLLPLLQRAFPAPDWTVCVHRAWPWLLTDIPSGRSYVV